FRLQQDRFEQLVDTSTGARRYADEHVLPAPLLGNHLVLGQLGAHAVGVRVALVDLVNRHHDRHAGPTRVLDGLEGLRHHTVVGGDHQHHDVGGLGAARTHRRERGVPGGIEEGDAPLRGLDVIGADVLRDAARLAGCDLGAPDVIEERGLAVVDVAHDGDHRRARRHLRLGLRALQVLLDLVLLEDLGSVAHLLDYQHRGVLVDRLIDGGHHAHVHQRLDDLVGLDGHLLCQLRHRDRLTDTDLVHQRRGRHLESMPPFGGRRQRPRLGAALLLVARADISGDVQLLAAVARVLLVVRHRRGGGGGDRALARRRWRRGERLWPLTLAGVPLVLLALAGAPRLVVAAALLGHPARVLLGAAARILLLDAAAVLRLEPLALAPLGFGALSRGARRRFGFLTAVVELVLVDARLLLEHVALDVGAFAAHLDIDGARAPLRAGELQLALGLAPEGDLARRAVAVGVAPVAAAQVREQLEFGVVADARVRTGHLDARLIELYQQPVHRHL